MIQGARIQFQGPANREPITLQGLGRLFPEGGFKVPVPEFPSGTFTKIAEDPTPLPGVQSGLSAQDKRFLLIGGIAAGLGLLALVAFR